jgi:hypothetical protein
MNLDRLHYELRLMGRRVILTPILVMVGFGVFAVLLTYLHVIPARFLSAGLEMILPLMAGVVVATITSQDPAIELQLTLPKKYHLTAMGRLILITAWAAVIALLSGIVIAVLNLAYMPQTSHPLSAPWQFLIGQLTWIAPLLWFVAFGLCLAMLIRSRAASAALLSGIWIAETLFKNYFAETTWLRPVFLFPTTLEALGGGPLPQSIYSAWLTNRCEVIGTALLLLPLGWLLLRNPEGLLKGSSEE